MLVLIIAFGNSIVSMDWRVVSVVGPSFFKSTRSYFLPARPDRRDDHLARSRASSLNIQSNVFAWKQNFSHWNLPFFVRHFNQFSRARTRCCCCFDSIVMGSSWLPGCRVITQRGRRKHHISNEGNGAYPLSERDLPKSGMFPLLQNLKLINGDRNKKATIFLFAY